LISTGKVEIRPAADLPELPVEVDPPVENLPGGVEASEQRRARDAVKNLLEASSVESILNLVHNAKSLAPAIKSYYGDKVAPVSFDSIVFDSGARVPSTNGRAYLFRVRSPDRPQGFPVSTEETPGGYKIDWEAYVQCKDRAMAKFWSNPEAPPETLFTVLQRAHYFDSDIPNVDALDCLKVTSPNPDEEPYFAFVPKGSELSLLIGQQILWDKKYFALATFTHAAHPGGKHVELSRVVRWVWRGERE